MEKNDLANDLSKHAYCNSLSQCINKYISIWCTCAHVVFIIQYYASSNLVFYFSKSVLRVVFILFTSLSVSWQVIVSKKCRHEKKFCIQYYCLLLHK